MADDIETQVEAVLEEIRPYLHSHGGEVNLVGVTPKGVVRLQLLGACNGCPMSAMTLRYGIERLLHERVPGLRGVESIDASDFEGFELDGRQGLPPPRRRPPAKMG